MCRFSKIENSAKSLWVPTRSPPDKFEIKDNLIDYPWVSFPKLSESQMAACLSIILDSDLTIMLIGWIIKQNLIAWL